jgi:hypothetical protein
MTVELAESGVITRTILPGISAIRIFTKIDRGNSIPDARWQNGYTTVRLQGQ